MSESDVELKYLTEDNLDVPTVISNESEIIGHENSELDNESITTAQKSYEYEYDETLAEVLTERHIKQIAYELGLITLCWPDIKKPDIEDRRFLCKSYYTNNDKERVLLLYTENFRRQFHFTFPDRRPLVLACDNECGIQKMVCTTLRPTTVSFPEMYYWECATFTSDHIEFEMLEKPTLMPERIVSPAGTLERERGNSFEMSTLLVSLLLGAGYDAYVVSGYAIYDITKNIQARVNCPLVLEDDEDEGPKDEAPLSKYQLKPPPDLRSQFILMMEQRELDRQAAEEQRKKDIKEEEIRLLEKPPPDHLHGRRVHAWALILPGKRDIEEPFFIESSTGVKYSIDCEFYLGLESIWNHTNYWVNLQSCKEGLDKLSWDLWNLECWEHLLVGEPIEARIPPPIPPGVSADEVDYTLQEKHLDMPAPWSEPIDIPFSLYERRYPGGKKVILYKKCRVEYFAEYVQRDGLVTRVTNYSDYELTDPTMIYEFYKHRCDHLYKTTKDLCKELVVHKFYRGRDDACKEHRHYFSQNDIESDRKLLFYPQPRVDGLYYLEMTPISLEEKYENREDRLTSRYVSFYPRNELPPGISEGVHRIAKNIVEKFSRDFSKAASHDVQTREFAIADNEIRLKYHYGPNKITQTTREFIKPPLTEMGDRLKFNPENTFGYNSEIDTPPPRQLELFYLLRSCLQAEADTLYHIRMIEDELSTFLRVRAVEQAVPHLAVSLFHPERNDAARQGLKEREQEAMEQSAREVDIEVDFLAPYLARFGISEPVTVQQAQKIRDACIEDLKQILVYRANDIQRQFNKKSNAIKERQLWFESIQDHLTRTEEDEYYEEMKEATFLLHTYEIRLERFRELASVRYLALEAALNSDPRLSVLNRRR